MKNHTLKGMKKSHITFESSLKLTKVCIPKSKMKMRYNLCFFIKINKFRAKAQKIIYAPYSDNYSQTVSVYVNRLNFILKK